MSVRRNVVANFLSGGWTVLLGLAMLPVYLRYLGIESYGLVGFFVALQAWLFLLDAGLTPTLNREMARFRAGMHTPQQIRDLLRSLEWLYAAVAVLLALGVASAATWIATHWLKLQDLSPLEASRAIALMGLVFGLQWMAALYRSGVMGLQQQVWLSGVTATAATLRALATVTVLQFVDASVFAFVAVQCAVSLVELAWLAARLHSQLPAPVRPPRFHLQSLRGVWRFAGGVAAISVLSTLLSQVDKLLLARLLPLAEFGYFSLAVTVAGALLFLIAPIQTAAYPRLSELVVAGDEAQFAREYHGFAQLLSIAVLPAALVLVFFADAIVTLWTQDPDVAGRVGPIASVWAAGTALNGLMQMPSSAQLASGWSRLTIVVSAVAVAAVIPTTLLLVPRHGAIAAAWIWVGINVAYAIFYVGGMHARILRGEKWRWYLQDVLKPCAAALLVVGAAFGVHLQVAPLPAPAELAFLALVLAMAAGASAAATPVGLRALGRARDLCRLRSPNDVLRP